MITIQVTSDSSIPELRVAERTIADLIKLAIGKDMEYDTLKANLNNARNDLRSAINEAVENLYVNGTSDRQPVGIFNAAELPEAKQLGKPVCSTVDASQSTTAHVDTTVNTSLPEPTSVFGQPAQTTENVANPAVPLSELHAYDADGIKWDKRIHSSSKELNKDGTWRKRRGVADELVRSVEAELRGAPVGYVKSIEGDTVTVNVTQPATTPVPPIDHSHEGETPVFTTTIPTEMTFPELLDGVTKAMVAGTLSQATIAAALDSVGLTALPHLLGNTALIPAFREALGGVV